MSAELLILGIIILIIGILGIGILVKFAGWIARILVHMILGWIALFLVNLIPFIHIPINALTVLIAGFGGILGVALLLITQALGFF